MSLGSLRVLHVASEVAPWAQSGGLADVVAVTDVYGAGEPALAGVSGLTVARAALEARPGATVAWTPTLDDALTWLRATVRPGDLVLTIGAGDVYLVGPRLVAAGFRPATERDPERDPEPGPEPGPDGVGPA